MYGNAYPSLIQILYFYFLLYQSWFFGNGMDAGFQYLCYLNDWRLFAQFHSIICIFSFLLYYLNASFCTNGCRYILLVFRVLRFISTIVRVFWSANNKTWSKLKGGQTSVGLILLSITIEDTRHYHFFSLPMAMPSCFGSWYCMIWLYTRCQTVSPSTELLLLLVLYDLIVCKMPLQ